MQRLIVEYYGLLFLPTNNHAYRFDLARRVGGTSTSQYVKVVDGHTIQGWMKCTPDGGGWGNGEGNADYTVYFYAQFNKSLNNYGFWSADIPDDWTRKRDEVVSITYLTRVSEASVITDEKRTGGQTPWILHRVSYPRRRRSGDESRYLLC